MDSESKLDRLIRPGIISYHQGDYMRAIKLFKRLLPKYPRQSEIYYYLGACYAFMLENPEISIAFFAKAIKLNPNKYEYFLELASSLNDFGDDGDTIKVLDCAIGRFPKLANAYSMKSFMLFHTDENESIKLAETARLYEGYIFDDETGSWLKEHTTYSEEPALGPRSKVIDICNLPNQLGQNEPDKELRKALDQIIAKYDAPVIKQSKTQRDEFSVVDLFNYYKDEGKDKV